MGRAAEAGTGEGFPDASALRAVFTGLGAGLLLCDSAGRITAVNPRAEQLLERTTAELLGEDAHDLLHRTPDGGPVPREACEALAVLESGHPARGDFAAFLTGRGELLPVEWTSAPLRRDDRIDGFSVLFLDATERLAMEQTQARHLSALESLTDRLVLVSEVSTVLTQILDVEETLHRLGRLLVPRLADWTALDLHCGRDELRRVVVVPPQGRSADPAWRGPLPSLTDSRQEAGLARVLRSGEPLLLGPDEIDALRDAPLTAAQGELFHTLGAASAIIAPLRTPREVVGALTVTRTDPSRRFDAADLLLLTDIGRAAGLAVDNARLFGRQRDISTTLQRHLLTPLPRVDGLQLCARYLPAAEGSEVGGDWYDAFLLADGVTVLVVGDVGGHDLHAAAAMAQLRTMLRLLAWDRTEPPSLILGRLDSAIPAVADVPLTSLLLARVEGPEGGPWELHYSNAGHPPPLLVTRDGESRYLDGTHDLLLGTRLPGTPPRSDLRDRLPAQSTLLLYTDGLVEAARSDLPTGLARLRGHAAALARHPLDEFCDLVLERMHPEGADDVALLALRLPQAGERAVDGV